MTPCNYFWGTHGCDLSEGHAGNHLCGAVVEPCCEYDENATPDRRVRWWEGDEYSSKIAKWSDWSPYSEGFR